MTDQAFGRRDFLKTAVVGGAAAATTGIAQPQSAQAQQPAAPAAAPPGPATYEFLNLDEAAFVETLVDHMVPADALCPKGTDLGIHVYIDRTLAGAWGRGDRLYRQGPWKPGVPSQGYQLPLTPAELIRAGIEASNAFLRKTGGKPLDQLTPAQREDFLRALDGGKVAFEAGPPPRVFWTALYQLVMEGMFADPVHGGNRDKQAWKMIGFPGVVANHSRNILSFRDKRYNGAPQGIADLS